MKELYDQILHATAWLYLVLFRTGPVYVDLWSFAHVISGFGLMAILQKRGVRRPWFWTMVVLCGYEIVELIFALAAIRVFYPEMIVDKLDDIVVGALAAWASVVALRVWPSMVTPRSGRARWIPSNAVYVAITIAFFWTGTYGYQYNVGMLNSAGLNWWAFLLWTCGLVLTLWAYAAARPLIRVPAVRLAAVWTAYAATLLLMEYVGYVVMGIRETSNGANPPMIWNLIHGTPVLRMFYLVAAPLAIALNVLGERLLGWTYRAPAPSVHEAAEAALSPVAETVNVE